MTDEQFGFLWGGSVGLGFGALFLLAAIAPERNWVTRFVHTYLRLFDWDNRSSTSKAQGIAFAFLLLGLFFLILAFVRR